MVVVLMIKDDDGMTIRYRLSGGRFYRRQRDGFTGNYTKDGLWICVTDEQPDGY